MTPPFPGQRLYLDGFEYVITDVRPVPLDTGAKADLVVFERPAPANATEALAHLENVNYRKGGKTADPLEFLTRPEILSRLAEQAARVVLGNPNPGLRRWAAAAAEVQRDSVPAAGAWCLADRLLMLPPSVRGGPLVLPETREAAERFARATLEHRFAAELAGGAATTGEG